MKPFRRLALADQTAAHLTWSIRHIMRRIVRWASAVRRGKDDRAATPFPAEFVPGGSTGPARGAKAGS